MRLRAFATKFLSIAAWCVCLTGPTVPQSSDRTSDVPATINQNIVTGTDTGADNVKRFDTPALTETASFLAFAGFAGGVRVAEADVNGDGVGDFVVGPGPGAGPQVKVFDGVNFAQIRSFFAYPAGFTGGIFVAAGDINGDARADIITGTDFGTAAHVKVFDSTTLAELRSFLPFGAFTGGARVASGRVNADGVPDIVVGTGPGGGQVMVFDGVSGAVIHNFLAYGAGYTGGVYVAAGDINADFRDDIVTGTDAGTTAHLKAFHGVTLAELRSFFPFGPNFTGGARVAAGRVNADAAADIVVGIGPGGPPQVQAYDGLSGALIHSFLAYAPAFSGGLFVAAPPIPVTTAAAVSISGRVLTPAGIGLRGAIVSLRNQHGVLREVRSSSFGYYRYAEVRAGETYVISVSSKFYRFTPRTLTIVDNLTDIDFIGEE